MQFFLKNNSIRHKYPAQREMSMGKKIKFIVSNYRFGNRNKNIIKTIVFGFAY